MQAIDAILGSPGEITFGNGWDSKFGFKSGVSLEYEPLYLPRLPGPRRIPAFIARWNCEAPFLDIKKIDQELKSCSLPFDGLADLANAISVPNPVAELFQR